MKTLYIECKMGAAGDMLTGALSELVNQQEFIDHMNSIGLEGVTFKAEPSTKCGITGTHISVLVNGQEEESHDVHHHEHSHMALFSWHLDGLQDEQKEMLIEKIKGIHDIEHVSIEEDILHYEYDHDHGDHAKEHLDEIIEQYASNIHLESLGHEHHHHHEHHHSGMHEIHHILEHLDISDQVRNDALSVYQLIAEAESNAHNMPVEQIHFHEVGTMDAVADIVAVCTLMEWIAPDKVCASPIAVGNGMVRCAHGILPVPAPATAYLLKGIPCYAGNMQGELCTPTGAALLKYFVQTFENMPVMVTEEIGYGMGKKDFEAANCVRAFLGESL